MSLGGAPCAGVWVLAPAEALRVPDRPSWRPLVVTPSLDAYVSLPSLSAPSTSSSLDTADDSDSACSRAWWLRRVDTFWWRPCGAWVRTGAIGHVRRSRHCDGGCVIASAPATPVATAAPTEYSRCGNNAMLAAQAREDHCLGRESARGRLLALTPACLLHHQTSPPQSRSLQHVIRAPVCALDPRVAPTEALIDPTLLPPCRLKAASPL